MSSDENKAVFQKLIELQEHGDLNTTDQVVAADWVNQDGSPQPLRGSEGFNRLTMSFRLAFPDMHIEIEDIVAEGDKVAARWRLRGTNSGPFQGRPPTGRAVDIKATGIFWVVDGKVIENRVNMDFLGLMQQLGFVLAPEQTS